MEALFEIDKKILFLVNHEWTNSFFDMLFPFITDLHRNPFVSYLFLPILVGGLIYYRRQSWMIFLGLALCVAWVDFSGGQLIKPYFERLRPNVAGLDVILRAPHFGGFSFLSNHSANSFAAATFLFQFHRSWGVLCLFYALLVAYSRVYCGVHFPSDVLGGAIYGIIVGFLFSIATKKAQLKWQKS